MRKKVYNSLFVFFLIFPFILLAGDSSWIYNAQIGASFKSGHGRYMNVENVWYYTHYFYKSKLSKDERAIFIKRIRDAHENGRRVITYAGPLEIISDDVDKNFDGKIDKGAIPFSVKHPDYLQVGISGRKAALLGYSVAKESFWVEKHAEDAWLTPNNPAVLKVSIDHILELASFGVDGIWLDVPHMNSWWVESVWEDEYPSYDKYSVELFKKRYGYPPPRKIDWQDEKWRNWIDFRYESITRFISTIRDALHKKYPDCKLIIEHWMGVGAESCDKACSAYLIRDACDVRGHEADAATYSRKSQKYYNLMRDLALYKFYRDIDSPDPSWILAYADSRDASLMLNAVSLTAGVNLYEANPPEMEGCVDPDLRREIFTWVEKRMGLFFSKELEEKAEVGIFYSTASEFYGDPSWDDKVSHTDSYFAMSILLTRLGIPFKTVVDYADLGGLKKLVVPHLTFESDKEKRLLEKLSEKCEVIRDNDNIAWKFWKAAKIGPNWAKNVSKPPNVKKCAVLQKKFKKLLNSRPVIEFDSETGIVSKIFYDSANDRYVLRILNLKGQNSKNIKSIHQTFKLKLNIPQHYTVVTEHKFLEEKTREFTLGKTMTLTAEINLFSIYKISAKNTKRTSKR